MDACKRPNCYERVEIFNCHQFHDKTFANLIICMHLLSMPSTNRATAFAEPLHLTATWKWNAIHAINQIFEINKMVIFFWNLWKSKVQIESIPLKLSILSVSISLGVLFSYKFCFYPNRFRWYRLFWSCEQFNDPLTVLAPNSYPHAILRSFEESSSFREPQVNGGHSI